MGEVNNSVYTPNFGCTKYIVGPDNQGYIYKYFRNDGKRKVYSLEDQIIS